MGKNRAENPIRKLAAIVIAAEVATSGLMLKPPNVEWGLCIPLQDMTPGVEYPVCNQETGQQLPFPRYWSERFRSGPGR